MAACETVADSEFCVACFGFEHEDLNVKVDALAYLASNHYTFNDLTQDVLSELASAPQTAQLYVFERGLYRPLRAEASVGGYLNINDKLLLLPLGMAIPWHLSGGSNAVSG